MGQNTKTVPARASPRRCRADKPVVDFLAEWCGLPMIALRSRNRGELGGKGDHSNINSTKIPTRRQIWRARYPTMRCSRTRALRRKSAAPRRKSSSGWVTDR